ncbi:MAG TPA: hypothetical protein DDX71_06060 [Ruminococcus sp.]|nr:hypothetical protein [Ruminococcus sp.]
MSVEIGCLSGGRKPNITERSFAWQKSDTISAEHLQAMGRLLRSDGRRLAVVTLLLLLPLVLFDGIFLLILLCSGHSKDSSPFSGLIVLNVISLLTDAVIWISARVQQMRRTQQLQEGRFVWRSGTLDDVTAEVLHYTRRNHRKMPVIQRFVYADGEKLKARDFYGTKIQETVRTIHPQKHEITLQITGELTVGSSVVLVKIDEDTYILPYNL